MLRRLGSISIFVTGLVVAGWNNTSTGIDLDKLRRFPLVKVRSGSLAAPSTIAFDGISAEATKEREVILRGAGKTGKRWEAHLSGLDQVWRGDLDGNGVQDYVLFSSGPYFNGRTTPPFSLSFLLMDAEGMPMPFFTVQYQEETGNGIAHLVELNRDGHAELLISTYDERPSKIHSCAFSSGHWTTQIYRFEDATVEETTGIQGGIQFPFIRDWAEPCAGNISKLEAPVLRTRGTSAATELPATLHSFTSDPGEVFAISPTAGCTRISAEVLVLDTPRLRIIAFPNLFTSFHNDLSEKIAAGSPRVRFRGVDRSMGPENCVASVMLADGDNEGIR